MKKIVEVLFYCLILVSFFKCYLLLACYPGERNQPNASLLAWFDVLAVLARKYLAIPATLAPSERVFSVAGGVCIVDVLLCRLNA